MKRVVMIAGLVVLSVFSGIGSSFAVESQQTLANAEVKKAETSAASAGGEILLKVPLFSSTFTKFPVATVNDEIVTLQDLNEALTSSHEERAEQGQQAAKVNYSDILERMINIRLIIQEARSMGLDDLPEVKNPVDAYSKSSVRDLLLEELGKDAKADEADVERLYKEVTKEWKIKSVMFRKGDDAKKMEEEMKAGKSFDEMVVKVLDEKLAEGNKEGGYVKPKSLQPEIAEIVSKMKINDISSIITMEQGKKDKGYVLLRLEDIRYPDDPEAKERAREVILSNSKTDIVREYKRDLINKYVKVNFKLIKKLDFESEKPGIENLSKDKRVIVEIKGEKPLTVGDMARALQEKYFHGLQTAIKSKNVNSKKFEMVDQMLDKILFRQEVAKRGIDKTEKYKEMVRKYEDSMLFGFFVQKVVFPDIKINMEEMKTYYSEHITEFTYPEMMKLDSIAFEKLQDAEAAMTRLKQGADFKWMRENSEGQIAKDTDRTLSFDGRVLVTTMLPGDIQKALSGAHSDDFRLYESPEGHYYVFYIRDLIPSRIQPFDEVKETISKNVFNKKVNQSVQEWSTKLRESGDIKIYLAGADKE